MTRSQKTYQLHRDLIEVGAYHIRMRIEPIGAILPISPVSPVSLDSLDSPISQISPISPVYPVRRKRKVEKIPGKSKFEEMLMKLMESEEEISKVQEQSVPVHVETIPERLEKLRIQLYTIQYILMSENTVHNLVV